MHKPTPWIERKFDFEFDHNLYLNILERLRYTPIRIETLVEDLGEDVLSVKPDGKWSIKEHIGHIATVEKLWDKRLDQFLTGEKELVGADMSNRDTENENFNDWSLDKLLLHLKEVRWSLISRLEKLSPDDFARTAIHPRLKKTMRLVDMMLFIAEHDDNEMALMRYKSKL